MTTLTRLLGTATLIGVLTLSGCGSDDTGTPADTTNDASAPPSGAPGGFDGSQLEEIQDCLDAAGLDDVLPTDMPTDMPSAPDGSPPSDLPSDMPTDRPSDGTGPGGPGGGGLGQLFDDPDVQGALDACGIELPSRQQ